MINSSPCVERWRYNEQKPRSVLRSSKAEHSRGEAGQSGVQYGMSEMMQSRLADGLTLQTSKKKCSSFNRVNQCLYDLTYYTHVEHTK